MWGIISSTGEGEYKTCRDAFLFSMVNPCGLGPTKMTPKTQKQKYAIYCESEYGPTFGGGFDLHISNNAGTNTSSYSRLGSSYERLPGQQAAFFTGKGNFTVTDYEVFGLHP